MTAPRPVGRPTDYKLEFCELAANLCVAGATDFEVAQALDVSTTTLYRWKAEHPEFRESLKVGKELADDRVETALYHRAVGYSFDAVKIMQVGGEIQVVPYIEHVPPDQGSISLWLSNRRREKWKVRQSVEHGGVGDGPIQVQSVDSATDEELVALAVRGRPAPTEPETSKD